MTAEYIITQSVRAPVGGGHTLGASSWRVGDCYLAERPPSLWARYSGEQGSADLGKKYITEVLHLWYMYACMHTYAKSYIPTYLHTYIHT